MENMTKEISAKEFKNTGMLLYINQVLQPFGLSIGLKEDNLVALKSKFRGFPESAVESAYKNINEYIKQNIEDITNI